MELCHSISAPARGCWPRTSTRLFWTRFLVLGATGADIYLHDGWTCQTRGRGEGRAVRAVWVRDQTDGAGGEEVTASLLGWVENHRDRREWKHLIVWFLGKKVLGHICDVASCWMRQLFTFYSNPTVTVLLKSIMLAGMQVVGGAKAKDVANKSF